MLKNWPERRIKVVMISNGNHVGPAGDLGVHAVNAIIAKLSLITAVGGVAPMLCLPILVDLGTNNQDLLNSQFYSGLRHKRVTGEPAQELMHEIMAAVERRFGNKTMIFFEDFLFRDSTRLLSQYRCGSFSTIACGGSRTHVQLSAESKCNNRHSECPNVAEVYTSIGYCKRSCILVFHVVIWKK